METGDLEARIFIICPVRDLADEEDYYLKSYISGLKTENYKVHYPPDDTNQNDPIGLNICNENKTAIVNADEVHIYFNPKSKGTMFDLGMTFMARKMLYIINEKFLTPTDDFSKFLFKYAYNTKINESIQLYENLSKRREEIKQAKLIEYEWKENSVDFLFDFGMAFMAEKPIILKNKNKVEKTDHKSFQNILLELDRKYRK